MMINRFAEPVVRVDLQQATWERALPETLAYQVDLSLLPLVNATGFSAGTRCNAQHMVTLAACR